MRAKLRFLSALAAALLPLAAPTWSQVSVVASMASPVGRGVAPLAPSPAAIAPVSPNAVFLAPSLSPLPLAPAIAADYAEGVRFFDGAASAPDALPRPARAPRGEAIVYNNALFATRLFSDESDIAADLIRAIDSSNMSIDIAIHGLALRGLAEALKRAKARNVRVRIIMNQAHIFPEKARDARAPEVQMLLDEGFEMKMLRGGNMHGIMHNKFAVFDGKMLKTGSFNWTHAANTWHWENALFFSDQARISAYQSYWDWMWSISLDIPRKAPPPFVPAADGSHANLPAAPQDPGRPIQFNGEEFPAQAFSPGGVSQHLIRAVKASVKSIDLANFSFTSEELRDALLDAKRRNVRVRIVFDADQYKFLNEMHWFVENGFDVLISRGKDGKKGVMHNKFAVFDGEMVEGGSFNWTRNGEKNNYENAFFLDAPDDVAAYMRYFARIRAQAWVPAPEDHVGPHAVPEGFDPHAF